MNKLGESLLIQSRAAMALKCSRFFPVLALIITLISTGIAYRSLGSPVLIGIDDANITQVYARNIANGYGYVYTPGFERVEGSTSLLWTLINAFIFLLFPVAEPWILTLCVLITAAAVYVSLKIFQLFLRNVEINLIWGLTLYIVFLSSIIPFYCWNVLTLMDLPLWTLLLLSLLYVILVRVIGQTNNLPRFAVTTSVLVVLMVLTRPESIVVVPALLFLGVFVEWCALSELWRSMRPYAPSLVTLIIAVAILTFARLIYFGMPFPNTYYAKVSANPLDNFTSGARYIFRFITNEPYGEVFVFGASASFLIFGIRTYFLTSTLEKQQSRFGHAVFVLSSTVLLLLGLPLFTGGDNFGAFRFYQPFYPLLFVPVFLLLPGIFRISAPYLARTDCRLKACGVVVIAGALILLQLYGVAQNYLAAFRFYQPFYPLLFVPVFLLLPGIFRISAPYLARTDRRLKVCGVVVIAGAFVLLQVCGFYIAQHHGHLENRMVSDFKLAAKGRRLGTALNTLYKDAPDLRVAVVAAGGIALTYNGRILDLMGLNWIQMAHASRRRTGISGHSAFNEKVFWSARPELINPVLAKSEPKTLLVHEFDHKVLKAIMAKEEFQAQYTGVSISVSDGYIVGFARTDWIGSYAAHHKVRMYKWSEVQTQKHV